MTQQDPTFELILTAMHGLGINWARLSSPTPSGGGDLDIASSVSAPECLSDLARLLPNIRPIMLSQYDIGGAHAVWFADTGRGAIRHVDFLSDVNGVGRLGIPTKLLLSELAGAGEPTPGWLLAYRVSKRLNKGQWGRLSQLSLVCEVPEPRTLEVVFGPAAGEIEQMVRCHAPATLWQERAPHLIRSRDRQRARRAPSGRKGLLLARSQRFVARLAAPVGIWIHVDVEGLDQPFRAEAIADAVNSSIARVHFFQPGARHFRLPLAAKLFLLRPGVVISSGRRPSRRSGAVTVSAAEFDTGSLWGTKSLVDGLSDRVLAHLP